MLLLNNVLVYFFTCKKMAKKMAKFRAKVVFHIIYVLLNELHIITYLAVFKKEIINCYKKVN